MSGGVAKTSRDAQMAARLYDIVREYEALGHHRTGTQNDARTIEWLEAQLRTIGAETQLLPYSFPMYRADYDVKVDGEPVEALPLFYHFAGDLVCSDAKTAELDVRDQPDSVSSGILEHAATVARGGAKALLVATRTATGDLYALNRGPAEPTGIPVLLVEGRKSEAVTTGSNWLRIRASIAKGQSRVVVGRFGRRSRQLPVIITTPLSGWFACASERGTGIAIALETAKALADRWPVVFVASTGHEIGYLGIKHFLKACQGKFAAVFHIGSSVAAADECPPVSPTSLTRQLKGIVSLSDGHQQMVAAALAKIGVQANRPADRLAPENWQGESECFAPLGLDMVSLAGSSPVFHTPSDRAGQATSPAILLRSMQAIRATAEALVDGREVNGR